MRREHFTLDFRPAGEIPSITVEVSESAESLTDRLQGPDGPLEARSVDVAYRLVEASGSDFGDTGIEGVIGVTNRVTGAFVLEVNAAADDVADFIHAAREATDDEGRYRLIVTSDDAELAAFEKRTLLVYDADGNLIREHSLIPSGVEI